MLAQTPPDARSNTPPDARSDLKSECMVMLHSDCKSERAGRIANPSERGGLQIRASGENKKFYIYIIKAKHIFFMLFAQKIRLYEL